MEALQTLQTAYLSHRIGISDLADCIDWALERLRLDQEGDDLDIVLLAGSTSSEEAGPLVERVVARYLDASSMDEQFVAGKHIAGLRQQFLAGLVNVVSLDATFSEIYQRLEYPDWMTMLARNCEYATDVLSFEEPFEQEFAYISELWSKAGSRAEFLAIYRREISDLHDVK